jgi:hypothetical protein
MITNTVTISMERYNELIAKEVVYELKRKELLESAYSTDSEKRLFSVSEIPKKSVKAIAVSFE